jgi:hypothetical protein
LRRTRKRGKPRFTADNIRQSGERVIVTCLRFAPARLSSVQLSKQVRPFLQVLHR